MIERPQSLWPDFIAGLSTAGLLLPEAVAYAGLANLPVQAGIVGLLVGLLTYGLFGRSRFAIVSATSSSAALLAASLGAMTVVGLASDRFLQQVWCS
jgi:sulfate permease, SulP family